MKRNPELIACVCLCLSVACAGPATRQPPSEAPHLETQGEAAQLVVDGQPFLMLAGELGNSTASNLEYLRQHWPRLQALHLNTVLAPVYWELVEPEEGRFDFALVDGLIEDARAHDLRLVLLWFGSWKNSMSSYAPAWVKRDQERFPRSTDVRRSRASRSCRRSHAANRDADALAFAALMRHLREIDGARHTVLMVQVENEIGMIPEARDRSDRWRTALRRGGPRRAARVPLRPPREPRAGAARALGIPGARLPARGRRSSARELAGRRDLHGLALRASTPRRSRPPGAPSIPLPLFVNAALIRPGRKPGEYPSAGPLPQVFDVWRAGAPTIDFLAPDIYFPNFVEWARAYDVARQPVLRSGDRPAARGHTGQRLLQLRRARRDGLQPRSPSRAIAEDDPLGEAYEVLQGLAPLILEHQGQGTLAGRASGRGLRRNGGREPARRVSGRIHAPRGLRRPWVPRDRQTLAAHGGLVIQLGPEEYLVAGRGLTVTFSADEGIVGIESIREGVYENGEWSPGRLLNGDQSHQGRHLRLPPDEYGVQRVRLYRYS